MLLPLTVAFLLGVLLGAAVPYVPRTILLVLLLLAVSMAALEWRARLSPRHGLLLYLCLLAGMADWAASDGHRRPLRGDSEAVQVIHGVVTQPVHHGPGRLRFVLDARTETEHLSVRVTWRAPDRELARGDVVQVQARLHPPSGALNFGGFDQASALRLAGIQAVASTTGEGRVRVEGQAAGWQWKAWRLIDDWRATIVRAAKGTLSGDALGVYLGMIVGESGYLTPVVRDVFMATGTVHILSISGSHLGLVAFLSFGLCRKLSLGLPAETLLALSRRITPTRLAALLTLAPVAFYTALAGAEVATVRSFIMIALFLLTVWLGRERHLLPALALAALVIVLHTPAALFEISFQLSFVSVLAIALLLPVSPAVEAEPRSLGERLQSWLKAYFRLTVGIALLTLPVVAYHFNQVAWLGVVANLLVVPFAGFVLVPVGLLSAVVTLLLDREMLVLGPVNQFVTDLLLESVRWTAAGPGAEWHVASPAPMAIAAYYLLLAVAFRPPWNVLRGIAAAGTVCLIIWWLWSPRPWVPGELRVTFLDVGQGDATVLELPDGQTLLIDGGGLYDTFDVGRSIVAPFLWDRGIRFLDHVIATHPQLDHVGGLISILEKFEVGRYWDNGVAREEPFYRQLMATLDGHRVARDVVAAGREILVAGRCRMTSLNPPAPSPQAVPTVSLPTGTWLNNASVVVELLCGSRSFLFPADIESVAIERLKSRTSPAEVLKVPHHGARSSHDPSWLARLQPKVAVISVGRHNAYGHPAPVVLSSYGHRRIQLLRTDRDGGVSIRDDGGSTPLEVTTSRDERPVALDPSGSWYDEWVNLGRILHLSVS